MSMAGKSWEWDRFYKGFVNVISYKIQSRDCQFYSRFYRGFDERGNVSRNAYKRNGFENFKCLFAKGASKSPRNDMFYKGLARDFSDVAICCFPNGFPGLFAVP